jgi:hypothetical protein
VGSSPDAPKEDPAAIRLRRQQINDLAKLDEEQNTRIKRLFRASGGLRLFGGSPELRLPRGNSAAGPAASRYGLTQYQGASVKRLQGSVSRKGGNNPTRAPVAPG